MLTVISNRARHGQAANPDEPGKCGDLREGKSNVDFLLPKLTMSQVTLAAMILYNPAIFFTKLSILLFYRRVFPSRNFHRILWAVGAFILAYSITSSMVNLLQCLPIEANWNPELAATAKCVHFGTELIAISTINAVTDLALLILPMPMLWGLHTSRNKKIQLMVIFALGTA
jgi:hypothetical protein